MTTGLGAVPFLLVDPGKIHEKALAVSNCVACGMMAAASVGMLIEASENGSPPVPFEFNSPRTLSDFDLVSLNIINSFLQSFSSEEVLYLPTICLFIF